MIEINTVYHCDALALLRKMPDRSVDCIITSPPYFGLRNYGSPEQIGQEQTPGEYIAKLVEVFQEAHRVLKDAGTVWLNLGDSYANDSKWGGSTGGKHTSSLHGNSSVGRTKQKTGIAPKNLIGIPWRVAFALQEAGWILRSEIIWHKCLSGGTHLYARTQKGEKPVMLKDLARLDPSTVQLWNGQRWTQVLRWERLPRKGTELELVLRSGERISCTPEHRFPTDRGLVCAGDLQVGDCLQSTCLPEPEQPYSPPMITCDAAWFVGMYLAEGSRSGNTLQISSHGNETGRLARVKAVAEYYGGSVTHTINGNKMDIRVYGRFLNALIDQYISGRTAKDKCLKVRCWSHDNDWLRSLLDGYLHGDGHWDAANNRWRLGFTRNYNLERDLRILCARLGLKLSLRTSSTSMGGRKFPTFRGEIRLNYSIHHNTKSMNEIVKIQKSRCREVYDVTVEDDPHLFALASGVLTHNSNPMPESVKDRPTKAHETVFLLAKSQRYYYDADAIAEPVSPGSLARLQRGVSENHKYVDGAPGQERHTISRPRANVRKQDALGKRTYTGFNERYFSGDLPKTRNKRDVWTVSTKPFKGAHFATFPPDLIKPMILAGCPPNGIVLDMFLGSGTTAYVAQRLGRRWIGCDINAEYVEIARERLSEPYSLPLFEASAITDMDADQPEDHLTSENPK